MEAGAAHPRTGRVSRPDSGRRLVGIDLGTTNSALAWVEASGRTSRIRPHLFDIPQLTSAGETAVRSTLPSFLYFPTAEEQASGSMALPWDPRPDAVAGVFARDHGALVPTRQVWSAKSWLSNPRVDRRAPLLPWTAEGSPKLSPVDASARLLAHLRDAWNYAQSGQNRALPLQEQAIVLTVPASFDEEARELTVEAARTAGFEHLTLLEEPLAAVYAWIASHPKERTSALGEGRLLLVCDIGGGTTDFSLIRAMPEGAEIAFERIAIGQHLLLGGDNVDLALAALVERKLTGAAVGASLSLTQRQVLRRLCSDAKERLLAESGPDRVPITLLGSGRGVVAGTLTSELIRDEALATLSEFLPAVPRDARPGHHVRGGLRELGLPYETDPAVTRHLAAFLARSSRHEPSNVESQEMVQPDAVLFNGGFFAPSIARERVLDTLASWFGRRPLMLANDAPEAAVAIGAAFYAAVRHVPAAARLLIRAGSPRSYYIAVLNPQQSGATMAVCVLPQGAQEGTTLVLDRYFSVMTNEPAAFTLLSSIARTDALNEIVTVGGEDDAHRHAPLVTVFRYGQRSRRVPLKVRLSVTFTAVGTLELWCESQVSEHRWRLQFNLRASAADEDAAREELEAGAETSDQVVIADEAIAGAERLLQSAFGSQAATANVDTLVGELENALGHGKQSWPLPVIRRLADVLLKVADGRRTSARHEARWLNLVGFCLRPGFGTSRDPWRITQARTVYVSGLAFPKEIQNQVEWLILWQRLSAGFTASQQQELAKRMIGLLGLGTRKVPRLNSQMVREAWRLLASLERLDPAQRTRLGDELILRIRREPQNTSFLWAIGRLGARVPFHGPLNSVVPPGVAERWLDALIGANPIHSDALAAAAQIAAKTDDPVRELGEETRETAIERLQSAGFTEEMLRPLREPVPVNALSVARVFGETLPEGLRLDSSE